MTELKNRKVITTTLSNELFDALEKLSERTRIPKTKLMDEAIEDLLKKHVRVQKGE